jgi:cytoskeletal protein CcmA (bactofilin family)
MSMIYDELKKAEEMRHNGGHSHISAGVRIKGEVSGSEDLVADGAIEGPVSLAGSTLSIGENGAVKGNIAAKTVVVHGTVNGNVEATDLIKVAPTGSITGDILTARIAIEDGARCKGAIDVGRK